MNHDRILKLLEFQKSSPNDPFFIYALATEYVAGGDDLKAKECFDILIQNFEHYTATYYHLGKLYERINSEDLAISTYEKGIEIAKLNNDLHSMGELRTALDELTF